MTSLPNEPASRPADWEAFYRDYRKPGYVPGFEITTKLGGGMFGLVFRARRMSIGKDYAIKFLQVEDGDVRKAVLSELEQVKYFAQIDHPNLVSIEDRGEVDGIPYLVMAFAGTETLRDKLQKRPPSADEKDELLRWYLQCCRGLAALHERSLVHFDVKPANVFLKGGVARLGDYGLSKLVTHSRGSLSMGRGTPYYMAPEMLQRRGDQRSDVYSLGILLYEILCGEVPFTGDSEWEVLRKHESEPPALPAHLTARERAVLLRCLAKDPGARYQSVHDLIAAFGAPASVGAAAWTDAGASTGATAAAAPPPSSPQTPPPLPGEGPTKDAAPGENPYAGLGRASREAFRHANTIAHEAYQKASRIARDAAEQARKMVRESVEKSRRGNRRRTVALQRLKRLHKGEDDRDNVIAIAGAVAAGPRAPRRHRGWWIGLTVAAACVMLPMCMFVAGAPHTLSVATSDEQRGPDWSRGDATSVFGNYYMPLGYDQLVSTKEPEWAVLATTDPEAAHTKLVQHIERLRAAAPLSPERRAAPKTLPGCYVQNKDNAVMREIKAKLSALLAARSYDDDIEQQLIDRAPWSLALAAEWMRDIDWQDRAQFERARRLQTFLENATGCDELPLIDEPDMSVAESVAANQHLGWMWLWFVNEFGHTPRAWKAYRTLLKH